MDLVINTSSLSEMENETQKNEMAKMKWQKIADSRDKALTNKETEKTETGSKSKVTDKKTKSKK